MWQIDGIVSVNYRHYAQLLERSCKIVRMDELRNARFSHACRAPMKQQTIQSVSFYAVV
jgi:hypothetical protein